jgi:hypothetical protein
LQLRPKEAGNRLMAFTFLGAIARFGESLGESDPGDTYKKAGVAFREQLQQKFVVLPDRQPVVVSHGPGKTGSVAGSSCQTFKILVAPEAGTIEIRKKPQNLKLVEN